MPSDSTIIWNTVEVVQKSHSERDGSNVVKFSKSFDQGLGFLNFSAGMENAFKSFVFLPGEVKFIVEILATRERQEAQEKALHI